MKIFDFMKTNHRISGGIFWIWSLILLVALHSPIWAGPTAPKILNIQINRTNVVVNVEVSVGLRKVTLESRSRLIGSAWVPRAVKRLDGKGESTSFSLPVTADLELLRVRGDENDPLPEAFYKGTNKFEGQATSTAGGISYDGLNRIAVTDSKTTESDSSRSVTESDIWKVDGNTLYFYNQYRGLQVINIRQPEAPQLTGVYDLPAAGEQMYLLPGGYVVLLARDNCYSGGANRNVIIILKVEGGKPSLVKELPVEGWIQESRMVGTALYVSTQSYLQSQDGVNTTWTWSSVVSSFDLANPLEPVVKDTLTFPGYNNTVAASEQFFFVATQSSDWNSSRLQLVDISDPTGAMKKSGLIPISGNIPDKFKIHQNGDVLTVISQTWNDTRRWTTLLQTFSLANPALPKHLGKLELAAGEQLHATRFDGNKAYIVTFFRIDPLWVVDLSDPTKPQIKGELEVPGWSTYLHPMGDRLLSVGIDTTNGWHVTVSLFDVADVTKPTLVDRAVLGGSWSWSEANNDEKAFNVLADSGLILLPWQGYSTNWTVTNGMQIIDFNKSSLTLRGVIPHAFAPRRATMVGDHIFSIDSSRLLSVAAPDRDHPVIKAELALSWNVSHVIPVGDYLLQVASNASYYSADGEIARILVTTATQPNEILRSLTLPLNRPIIGITRKNDRLYIAQSVEEKFSGGGLAGGKLSPIADGFWGGPFGGSAAGPVHTTIVDVSKPLELSILGTAENKTEVNATASGLQAFWPKPGILVWSSQQQQGWGYYMRFSYWSPSFGNQTFYSLDVNEPTKPQALCTFVLGTNTWAEGSSVFQAGTLFYSSHHEYETVTTKNPDTKDGVSVSYLNNTYLDVVDFSDPTLPVARPLVSIPNNLNGISTDGNILYLVGYHVQSPVVPDYFEYLDIASYDGVSAYSISSTRLSNYWPRPLTILDNSVYLGVVDEKSSKSVLQQLRLNKAGALEVVATVALPIPAQGFGIVDGQLLIRTASDMSIYDLTSLQPIAFSESPGCYYWSEPVINGSVKDGFWASLGQYGVIPLRVSAKP